VTSSLVVSSTISRNRISGLNLFDCTIISEHRCGVILYANFGHLIWAENYQWLLPTGRCHFTYSLCFHAATALCVTGQNTLKGHLATTVAWLHILRLSSVGSNERCSLQENPHTLLEMKETIADLTRNSLLNKLLRAFANKTCRCVSTSSTGKFSKFLVTLLT
jgi:hypothetical protein